MKKLFDPHRHQLSEGEKEFIWRRINEPEDLRAARRTTLWRRWGYSGAVVLAALMVAILWRPEDQVDRLHSVPVPSEVAPQGKAPGTLGMPEFKDRESPENSQVRNIDPDDKAPGTLEETVAEPINLDDKAPDTAREVLAAAKSAAPVEPEMNSAVAPTEPARRDAAGSMHEDAARKDLAAEILEVDQAPVLAEIKVDPAPVEGFKAKSRGTRSEAAIRFGAVRGVVIDRDSGTPLPYVNIVVVGTNYGCATREDGSFEMRLPEGSYTLKCIYMGYEDLLADNIIIQSGYVDSLEFALVAASNLTVDTIIVEGEEAIVDVGASVARKLDSRDEAHVRGGRSGEIKLMAQAPGVAEAYGFRERDDRYTLRHRPRCWVPPYYHNPNGEPFDAMYFEHYGTNPFVVTEEDAQSTFALDVDNASYTLARSYLERGELPPKDAIRVEEFINYFEQGYESCDGETFCLNIDGAPSPFGEGYHLLRVGVQTREISQRERRPANLIFVVDTSGSMDRENRLGLVKRALLILLDELRDSDTVGIVEYGSQARMVLGPTAVEDRRRIERALNSLVAGGSTNAEAGLWLGYEMASKLDTRDTNTRLILCSDGVANTGETQAEKILDRVRMESDRGIALSSIGFGMGNYNDVLMEKLADKGDGNYFYVDALDEASRVFRENLTGTLQTLARDAKIQVEFDSEYVLRWRLIGYENRDIADEDFRNDEVDAGELGSGHQVTALYEIKLSDEAVESRANRRRSPHLDLGEIHLRYEHPKHSRKAGKVEELSEPIELSSFQVSYNRADSRLQLTALVAEFAEILRGSYWAKDSEFEDLLYQISWLREEFPRDDEIEELHDLIQRAAHLDYGMDR